MPIKSIKRKISQLNTEYSPSSHRYTTAHSRLLCAYHSYIRETLERIIGNNEEMTPSLVIALQSFLKQNWEFVQGSLLCYTALGDDEHTLLLCEVANDTAKARAEKALPAIRILMPTVAYVSCSIDYPDLDTIPLQRVLKTHCLGLQCLSPASDYLIPVALLVNLTVQDLLEKQSYKNVYFDYQQHDQNAAYLSDEEIKRLSAHSIETKAISTHIDRYRVRLDDTHSLLGQLRKLIQILHYCSEEGVGSEKDADEGGYADMIDFMEYYASLNAAAIPSQVHTAIRELQNVGSDASKNRSLESCFGIRIALLHEAIAGQEERLSVIRPSKRQQEKAVGGVLKQLQNAQKNLRIRLDNPGYAGRDQLGMTDRIMRHVKIDLHELDFNSLVLFLTGMRAKEISTLCALPGALKKIVNTIRTVKNLVLLCRGLREEAMQALFNGIGSKIKKIIDSNEKLRILLIPLEVSQCAIVCHAVRDHCPSLIPGSNNFIRTLHFLDTEQRTTVHEAFKEQVYTHIKDPLVFSNILKYSTPEHCIRVCEDVEKRLVCIMNKRQDLNVILQNLTAKQCASVCQALEAPISLVIGNSKHLNSVLTKLSEEQCAAVCQALATPLSLLIKHDKNLISVLKKLTPEKYKAVCQAFAEPISWILIREEDNDSLLKNLSSEKYKAVCQAALEHTTNRLLMPPPAARARMARFFTTPQLKIGNIRTLPSQHQLSTSTFFQDRGPSSAGETSTSHATIVLLKASPR